MELFVYILLGLSAAIILFSIYDLYTNKFLDSKYKTNYYFILFALPVVGSVIYFYTKKRFYNEKE